MSLIIMAASLVAFFIVAILATKEDELKGFSKVKRINLAAITSWSVILFCSSFWFLVFVLILEQSCSNK